MKFPSAFVAMACSIVLANDRLATAQEPWEYKALLSPNADPSNDPSLADNLGLHVAIDGNTAIVGSYGDGSSLGSARVFVRTNVGSNLQWTQQDIIIVDDGLDQNNGYMGYTVAVDGDTALIGAYKTEPNMIARLFVFVRSEGIWTQQAVLHTEYDGSYFDDGRIPIPRVALEGNTAVLGRGYDGKGKVFVYVRDAGDEWSEQAMLEDAAGRDGDYFGADVDISGDKILVGATEQNRKTDQGEYEPIRKGKAYVFTRTGTEWDQEGQILLPDAGTSDILQMGNSVALSGNTALVGAGSWGGAPHVFVRDTGTGAWSFQATLVGPIIGDTVGMVVALQGNTALVGGPAMKNSLFVRGDDSVWSQETIWSPLDSFGSNAVALSADGTTAIVGPAQYIDHSLGSAFIIDNFSILPDSPLEIEFTFLQIIEGSNPPYTFSVVYKIGRNREFHDEFLMKDCATPLTDLDIVTVEDYPHVRDLMDLTHDYLILVYEVDKSTAFNVETGQIEVCHVLSLVTDGETDIRNTEVLNIDYNPGGCINN